MLVLGIHSATTVASVAVVNEDKLVAEFLMNTRKTHSQRLMPLLNMLLEEAELKLGMLDGLAVAIGPGSFTGLRIGLATVKGLALVTGLPVAGISTLDGMAWNAPGVPGIICPLLNARKQEVYAALYRWENRRISRLSDYLAVNPAQLAELLKESGGPVTVLGDGAAEYSQMLRDKLGDRLFFMPAANALPRAAHLAALGLERLRAGPGDDLHTLGPLYIRLPEAEVKWRERNKDTDF